MTWIASPTLGRAVPCPSADPPIAFAVPARRVYVETMGCQMNVVDSERMAEALARDGYIATDSPEDADLAIVNTCSIRDKVEHKVVSLLGVWRKLKDHNPDLVLAVAGCVAQQEGARLLDQIPYLDLVIGPDQIERLPALVADRRGQATRAAATEFVHRNDYAFPVAQPPADGRVAALVTVMKGCNKVCAFCIVPFTRGREVSKPARDVVAEVAMLADHGVREVTLLGQNVNSYGKDRGGGPEFAELLHAVAAVPGIARIRFTTSHPMDCSDALIDAFASCAKLMPFFHLPIQSGSARVLLAMRRHHGVDDYLDRVARLRRVAPEVALSTDIIVGYPGETEADFLATIDLLRQVRYATIFSFLYSPRPGTRAAQLDDDVPIEEKKRRIVEVQRVQAELTAAWMAGFADQTVEVLFEGASRLATAGPNSALAAQRGRFAAQAMGRTRHNVKVNVAAPDQATLASWQGQIGQVRVSRVGPHALQGDRIDRCP